MKAKLYQSITVLQKELNGVVISKFHLLERNVSIEERRFFFSGYLALHCTKDLWFPQDKLLSKL